MPRPSRFADVRLDVDPHARRSPAGRADDIPFRILLMGDFSGRDSQQTPPPPRWKPVLIDRDNFDQVLGSMGASLSLGAGAPPGKIRLQFRDLEDFHPDRIYEHAECFRTFRETRQKLTAPSAKSTGGAERGWGPKAPEAGRHRGAAACWTR